jgi:hypothetical protein
MAYSLTLRVTHSGTTNSSIYINDIHDGKDQNGRVNNRKPPQYVPINGFIDMLFTEQVQYSYESGAIRNLLTQGLVTTDFLGSVGGALEIVSGTQLWDFDPSGNGNDDPDVNDQGIRLNGKSGVTNGFADIFFDEDNSALRIVMHEPTARLAGSDDADIYILSSAGANFNNGEGFTSGGEIDIYTGKGYDSTEAEDQGTEGGDFLLQTGNGGDFGGSGGDIEIISGAGGNGGGVVNGGNGGYINITSGNGGSNGANGGDITLTTGEGNGAGNKGGDIILDPASANGGADAGIVLLYNEVRLGDYNTNGLLSTSNGDGLIDTPITFGRGRATVAIDAGENGTITFTINNASVSATNTIVVTLEPSDANLSITSVPYISARVNATSFTVKFNVVNADVGNPYDMYVNYYIMS